MGRRSSRRWAGGGSVSGALVVFLLCVAMEPGPCHAAAFHPQWEPMTRMSSFHTGEDLIMRNGGVLGAQLPPPTGIFRGKKGRKHYISGFLMGDGWQSSFGGRGPGNTLARETIL